MVLCPGGVLVADGDGLRCGSGGWGAARCCGVEVCCRCRMPFSLPFGTAILSIRCCCPGPAQAGGASRPFGITVAAAARRFQASRIDFAAAMRSLSSMRSWILSMTLSTVEIWFGSSLSSRQRRNRQRWFSSWKHSTIRS